MTNFENSITLNLNLRTVKKFEFRLKSRKIDIFISYYVEICIFIADSYRYCLIL